jgi:hypothetical protein
VESRTLTILTTCKNRNNFLYDVLPNWLEYDLPIIVIDYSSDEPVSINHPSVTIHRFEGREYFNLCHALNLGFLRAETDLVLRMDCDVRLPKETVYHFKDKIKKNQYIPHRLNWKNIGTGTTMMWTEHFHKLNGYQEFCRGWGYDDVDFNRRLHRMGIQHFDDLLPTRSTPQIRSQLSANYQEKTVWLSNFLNIWRCKTYENHVHKTIANYGKEIGAEAPLEFVNECPLRILDDKGNEITPLDVIKIFYRDQEHCLLALKHMKAVNWEYISCMCEMKVFARRFQEMLRYLLDIGIIRIEERQCQSIFETSRWQTTPLGE